MNTSNIARLVRALLSSRGRVMQESPIIETLAENTKSTVILQYVPSGTSGLTRSFNGAEIDAYAGPHIITSEGIGRSGSIFSGFKNHDSFSTILQADIFGSFEIKRNGKDITVFAGLGNLNNFNEISDALNETKEALIHRQDIRSLRSSHANRLARMRQADEIFNEVRSAIKPAIRSLVGDSVKSVENKLSPGVSGLVLGRSITFKFTSDDLARNAAIAIGLTVQGMQSDVIEQMVLGYLNGVHVAES